MAHDPGVVPNFLQTGAGSPTGICFYEGTMLPKVFQGQVIHCDAGPNVCRAYPAKPSGAGYEGEMVNILESRRDRWFRPSDVSVAPDGSLFVADWYDPGVGGHGMGDIEKGRIFRVTRERVRQIEAKAVRKLLHPVRARKLSGFLDASAGPDALALSLEVQLVEPQVVVRHV